MLLHGITTHFALALKPLRVCVMAPPTVHSEDFCDLLKQQRVDQLIALLVQAQVQTPARFANRINADLARFDVLTFEDDEDHADEAVCVPCG